MTKTAQCISVSVALFICFFFAAPCSYSFSDEVGDEEISNGLKEFSMMSGWGNGKLKRQDNYEVIPLYLQFGFDIKPLLKRIHCNPKGDVRFLLEPFLNTVIGPDSNVEAGCDFLVKYSHPIINKINFYIELGVGMMYSSQHTYEQATQFNFTEQAGGGLSFLFAENKTFNIGYRYRHFSNAGLDEPNGGVDVDFILCGISMLY